MLQYSTIEPGTLGVLKKLMQLPELQDFHLAGGTAVALYYGHRMSVDIDLFSSIDFQTDGVAGILERHFPTFTYSNINNPVGIFAFIDDVKVDFIRHNHFALIGTPVIEDGIRLVSINDIMAMKVAAILKRGVKKDFWDISELLYHHSIADFIDCYNQKYPNQQLLISIPHAMVYFADAEDSDDPISLKGQSWESVKEHITAMVNDYMQ